MFDLFSSSALIALGQVVMIDLVLAGDNAIVIGLAAAGLPAEQRTRAILIGIVAATVLRIVFAGLTTQLLQIVGLLFAETPVLYAPLGRRCVAVAPATYALPMFTVYTGKQPIADRNAPARRVTVTQVLGAVRSVLARS